MNRRRFCASLAALGGAVVAGPLLGACSKRPTAAPALIEAARATSEGIAPAPATAAATAPAAATEVPARARIALVRTTDRADGVRRAIELLDVRSVSSRSVLLKPNFNSADPAPGSTHEQVLRALLAALADMGALEVTVADRSGVGDTSRVMREKGVPALVRRHGARTVALEELPDDAWTRIEHEGHHWPRGFLVPRVLLEADYVVQTCNLKTHRHGGHFTMSLKNTIGLVAKHHGGHDYMSDLHSEPHQRRMIAEANTVYAPDLVVIDGVKAFVKGGPDTGTVADTAVVLAGTDRVALDAVGVAILRLHYTTPEVARGRVFEQEQIARAVELGLGVDGPDRIDLVTGDAASSGYAERIRTVLAG